MRNNRPHVDFVELHILHHASGRAVYGLWMIEELAEHGYNLSASQLYPKFHRLEKKGRLMRTEKVVEGKLRKYYRATRDGRAYFKEQKRCLVELISEELTVSELSRALERRQKRQESKRRAA